MAEAIQDLILARETLFDNMVKWLKELPVRRVIGPLIIGDDIMDKTHRQGAKLGDSKINIWKHTKITP